MASAAHAAPIVYTVNDTIGSVSIFGTLTTDGTIGTGLGSSIFTNFALTVTNGITPTLFTPANAFVSPGNTQNVIATATTLSLGSFGGLNIFNPPPGDGGNLVWLIENFGLGSLHLISNPVAGYNRTELRTTTTFAVVRQSSSVPEPTTLALLASGVLGLGLMRRRQATGA